MRTAREAAAFTVVALGLLAWLFRDALLHGYVLGQGDILYDFVPWKAYQPPGSRINNRLLGDVPTVFYPFLFHARQAILSGEFPLWSSAMGAGQPFFAAFQSAVLSPFSLFNYLLPFPQGFTADVAARLLAGGVGMFLFLRALPVSRAAAAFGGVAFLLNPFSIVWLEHPLSAAAAGLPWLLLTVERCAVKGGVRAAAALAAVTALALLTGHPETTFKVLLLAGAYALYRGAGQQRFLRTTVVVLGAMSLGLLLTAVQVVPFVEYMQQSRVLAHRGDVTGPQLTTPAMAFVTTFIPDFYGTPLRSRFVLPYSNYNEMQLYPGIVTWLFAALALTHRVHRGRALFFLAAGAVAVLTMYGTPVAQLAVTLIPPLRVAALSRFGLIAITGIGIAGAIGFDAVFNERAATSTRSRLLATVGGALAILVVVTLFVYYQRAMLEETRQWTAALRATREGLLWLALALGVVLVALKVRHPAVAAAAVLLLAGDLLGFAAGYHKLLPRERTFQPAAALAVPQGDRGLFRVVGWADALLPNTALVYGLPDVRSYDGLGLRDYSEVLDLGFQYTGASHALMNAATPHILDFLNVKYVIGPADLMLPADRFTLVHDGSSRVYENLRVMPRAFLVGDFEVMPAEAMRRAIRDGFGLGRTVLLDAPPAASDRPDAVTGSGDSATMMRYTDHHVTVETEASGRRLLVFSDAYYPGWEASVDGAAVPIYKANHAFRAVSVPAGRHKVEFHYRPSSLRMGIFGSLAGCVILAGLFVAGRRQRE